MTTRQELEKMVEEAEGAYNGKEYEKAIEAWGMVLKMTSTAGFGTKERILAMNGLALAYLSKGNKILAYEWSDQAIREAKTANDPALIVSAKKIRDILLKESKKLEEV